MLFKIYQISHINVVQVEEEVGRSRVTCEVPNPGSRGIKHCSHLYKWQWLYKNNQQPKKYLPNNLVHIRSLGSGTCHFCALWFKWTPVYKECIDIGVSLPSKSGCHNIRWRNSTSLGRVGIQKIYT